MNGIILTTEIAYLLGCDGFLRRLGQFFNGLGVVSQIALAADKDDGKALAEMEDFGDPLGFDMSALVDSLINVASCTFS